MLLATNCDATVSVRLCQTQTMYARFARTFLPTMKSIASKIKLNDGNEIPCVGFGVYNANPGKETEQAVLWALEACIIVTLTTFRQP